MKKFFKFLAALILIALIAIIILSLAGFDFGLGGLSGFIPSFDKSNNTSSVSEEISEDDSVQSDSQETEKAEETETEADNTVKIEISDTEISVNGQSMADTDELKKYLLENHTDSSEYVIIDNHAIKSVYDDVKSVFGELSYDYTEQE